MEHFFIDLTLEISDGAIHNPLGHIRLLYRLRAGYPLPCEEKANVIVMYRTTGFSLSVMELSVELCEVAQLITLLQDLGFPGKSPDLTHSVSCNW